MGLSYLSVYNRSGRKHKLLMLIGTIGLLFFTILIYEILVFQYYSLTSSSVLPVPVLEVKPGMSVRSITKKLFQTRGVRVPPGFLFEAFIRYNKQAHQLKAGEYRLTPGITPKQLLAKMVSGDVLRYSFTIIEGWTTDDLLKNLAQQPQITHSKALKLNTQIEGLFFPDTYYFPKGTTDVDFLNRCFATLQKHLDREWKNRDPDIALKTPYEALILASIIEKETAVESERTWVSGVFHERLKQNMKLQADPTVIYGLGPEHAGKLTSAALRQDNPHNTYVHKGLPPTPIALAGLASIQAALHPQKAEPYLYFVSKGDGTHYFSKTIAEHNQAVNKYILGKNKVE